MQSNARSLSDAWWAERAKRFLNPTQVQIIEAFHRAGKPLSVRELTVVFDHLEDANLEYHVRRLKQLGALEVVGGQSGVDSRDVQYRLVADQATETARTPVAVEFGKNLAECRMRARASYEDLACSTSLREEKISALEEGECEPSVDDVVRLAVALPATMSELLGGIRLKSDLRGGSAFELPDVSDASFE